MCLLRDKLWCELKLYVKSAFNAYKWNYGTSKPETDEWYEEGS